MHRIISPLKGVEIHGKDEVEYFEAIISNVNTGVDHTFMFTVWDWPLVDVPEGAIVFSTSDERHRQPIEDHLQKNVFMLFKQYWPFEPICDDRVFPLPLGYLTGFMGSCSTPILQRKFDYFFSGSHNSNGRDDMGKALSRRSKDGRRKHVEFYDGWAKGMKMGKYSLMLSNTKIALCPPGYLSSESFRIFEAARCGCVLLVGDGRELKMPRDVPYYRDFPGIFVDDWSDLSIIDELLKDPARMKEISRRTVDWYNRCIDPKAVGSWMSGVIKERMRNL